MATFWSIPCKKPGERYRYGWMMSQADRWRVFKERPGARRRITHWFIGHTKTLRPNLAKRNEDRRWRLMGYDDRKQRPSLRIPHSY